MSIAIDVRLQGYLCKAREGLSQRRCRAGPRVPMGPSSLTSTPGAAVFPAGGSFSGTQALPRLPQLLGTLKTSPPVKHLAIYPGDSSLEGTWNLLTLLEDLCTIPSPQDFRVCPSVATEAAPEALAPPPSPLSWPPVASPAPVPTSRPPKCHFSAGAPGPRAEVPLLFRPLHARAWGLKACSTLGRPGDTARRTEARLLGT